MWLHILRWFALTFILHFVLPQLICLSGKFRKAKWQVLAMKTEQVVWPQTSHKSPRPHQMITNLGQARCWRLIKSHHFTHGFCVDENCFEEYSELVAWTSSSSNLPISSSNSCLLILRLDIFGHGKFYFGKCTARKKGWAKWLSSRTSGSLRMPWSCSEVGAPAHRWCCVFDSLPQQRIANAENFYRSTLIHST